MLKSKFKKELETPSVFPMMAESINNPGLVVLFDKMECGMVVAISSPKEWAIGDRHFVGKYSQAWCMTHFVPIKGSVTITQE